MNTTLQNIHAGREVLYSLFYRIFIMTPDTDLYDMLGDLMGFMHQTVEGDIPLEQAVKKIEQFLTDREKSADSTEFDLETQRCYTRLFCMTNSVRTCQSHFESENKLSRDEPYDKCLELYARYGMPKDERYKEDADFIAEQLRFMSYMASLSNEAVQNSSTEHDNYLQVQLDFINTHLKWLGNFMTELKRFEEAESFYIPVSEYMLGFIQADKDFLQSC